MQKNKIKPISSIVFMIVFVMGLLQANFLKAAVSSTGYDFGQVEVGSTATTAISITNLEDTSTTITGIVLAKTDCNDFFLISTPESMTIPPNETIAVEVGFKPSTIGTCSDTLRIYSGSPFPHSVTLTGTGIEATSARPDTLNVNQTYLAQVEDIKSFMQTNLANAKLKGSGNGKSAEIFC